MEVLLMGALSILNRDVIQANPLIHARKEMNLTELRLFALGLQDIVPHITDDVVHDLEFHETLITHNDLVELFGSDNNGRIANLKKQVEKAYDGKIKLSYKDGGFGFRHIYKKIDYIPQKGLVILFDDEIKKYILEILNQAYTKYKVKALFSLQSAYAWRLLESILENQGFFKQGHSKIYKYMSVEEVRFQLNVADGLYEGRMNNFKRKVIDEPIKDINEKTDYNVTCEAIKTGRKTTGFKFWLEVKKKEKKALNAPISEEENYPSETTNTKPRGLSDEEQEAYDSLVNREVDPDVALQLAKKYNLSQIKRNIKYALERKNDNTKNLKGMIVSYIRQDKAGVQAIQKKEAQERIAQRQLDRRQAYDDFHGTHLAEIGRARADGAGEQKEKQKPNPNELSDNEAQFVITFNSIPPYLKEKTERLGLTLEKIKAGKRK